VYLIRITAVVTLVIIASGCRHSTSPSDEGATATQNPNDTKVALETPPEEVAQSARAEYPGGKVAGVVEGLARYFADSENSRRTVYLSFLGKDPSGKYLERFADCRRPVKKGSFFEVGKGIHVQIKDWKFLSEGEVQMTFTFYIGNTGAGRITHTLILKDGAWSVDRDKEIVHSLS
jgi:hypothetical protein